MSDAEAVVLDRAEALRRSFDATFAVVRSDERPELVDLLAVRIAGKPFALRLAEAAALLSGRRVVRLPTARSDFLGVIGYRGLILPIYSLRAYLGYPRGEDSHWVVLTAMDDRVGLAFDQYEGYLRLPTARVAPPDRPEAMPAHVRAVARPDGAARQVLDLPSILDSIKRRPATRGPSEER